MKPTMKSKCLMCCGCGRFMLKDGSVSTVSVFNNGGVAVSGMRPILNFNVDLSSITDTVFSGDTEKEIDDFALKQGWTVKDTTGKQNHRCRACGPVFKPESRTGKIFDTFDLFR